MGISHEALLDDLNADFPDKIEEAKELAEIEPPVKEKYLRELCEGDEGLTELFDEMLEYFYRYAHDVFEQESLIKQGITENKEEIDAREAPRTALHNAMIDSVKILARNLRQRGKDASWIDSIDKKGRAGYASLALLTTIHDIIDHNSHHGKF